MKKRIVSGIMLTILLTGILKLSYPPTFGDGYNPAADIQDPHSQMYMDKPWYNFTYPPSKVGTKFHVDIYSYNISNLYAFQVVLDYNSTLLNCTNAWPNEGWDDPDWVFNKYGAGAKGWTGWVHYDDRPTSGRSAELVGDVHFEIANISLTGIEALMARFEFEILEDPEENEELSCVISITSNWFQGTFVQSVEEASALQKRSPWLTDSYYVINDKTIVHYVWSEVLNQTTSWNDEDPVFQVPYFSGNFNITFSHPDANGTINLTIPKETTFIKLSYYPVSNTTVHVVPISNWYGKLYTVSGTGDVDIKSMTNDTGLFFWKDGAWHPSAEEWLGDGTPDPAGSAWWTGMVNTRAYQGNGTEGALICNYNSQLWYTTGFSENTVIEPASRLNGFCVNATGVPFPPPYVGTIGTFVFTSARLNNICAGGHLDHQSKTNGLEVTPPVFLASLFSPANLYVTDPLNRHIGTDPTTGESINEIPDAFYSGPGSEPQRIAIPNPLDGVYDIEIVGTGTGEYTSVVEYATVEKITTHTYAGNISVGQILAGEANISEGEMAYTPQVLLADLNDDQSVNILDAIILAGAFGSEPGDPNWNPYADINQDGIVNILDAIILAGHFGEKG